MSRFFDQYRPSFKTKTLLYLARGWFRTGFFTSSFIFLVSLSMVKLALQLSIRHAHVPLLSVLHHDASTLVLLKISCLVGGKLKQEESILELWSTQTVQARLR
jgi:uncharacterized membrane protein